MPVIITPCASKAEKQSIVLVMDVCVFVSVCAKT